MSVLITGIAGFIGSHTVDYFLSQNREVVGCDSLTYAASREEFKKFGSIIPTYESDINDTQKVSKIVKDHNVDTILNFAAETHVDNSIRDVGPFLHSNISGVISLLNVVRENGIKMIHVSTDEVYGPAVGGVTFFENDALSPMNPYAASKASADLFISSFKNTYDVNVGIIRPCNNFGPRQHREKFIPTILSALRSGRKIPMYGNGKQIREWMFVKDTARIIHDIMHKTTSFDTLNISTQHEMENINLVRQICHVTGNSFDKVVEFVPDRPGHDVRYSISNEKISKIISLKFTDFSDAINETIQEMR